MGVLEDLKEGLAIYSNDNNGSKLTESDMGSVLPGNPHYIEFHLDLLHRPWFYRLSMIQGNDLEETQSSGAECLINVQLARQERLAFTLASTGWALAASGVHGRG